MEMEIKITGLRPLIMHNVRLVNPFDEHTRGIAAITSKKKKTEQDKLALMRAEALGGCYETADGLVGLPTANLFRCLYDSATKFKLGTTVKKAVLYDDVTVPLLIDGDTMKPEEAIDAGMIDHRAVRVTSSRVMRTRPRFENWEATVGIEVLEDELDPTELVPILERAGRLVGLCEWRPIYGRFSWEIL